MSLFFIINNIVVVIIIINYYYCHHCCCCMLCRMFFIIFVVVVVLLYYYIILYIFFVCRPGGEMEKTRRRCCSWLCRPIGIKCARAEDPPVEYSHSVQRWHVLYLDHLQDLHPMTGVVLFRIVIWQSCSRRLTRRLHRIRHGNEVEALNAATELMETHNDPISKRMKERFQSNPMFQDLVDYMDAVVYGLKTRR